MPGGTGPYTIVSVDAAAGSQHCVIIGKIAIPGHIGQTIGNPSRSCPTLAIPGDKAAADIFYEYCGLPVVANAGANGRAGTAAYGGTFYVSFGDQSQTPLSLAGAIYNPQ